MTKKETAEFSFPKFSSSDAELDITYAYRCELYFRHLKETPSGYVITEFLPEVPWAELYNTISCAASHHYRDGRWLSSEEPLSDYARFWCRDGKPRKYSFPIADSILAFEAVKGSNSLSKELYTALKKIVSDWDDHKTECGMYRQRCMCDGMELSISGDGIRPTINSYMAADKYALASIATSLGKSEESDLYLNEADFLKKEINRLLWNEKIGMFGVISDKGEMQNVREQIGYIPWIYGLADEGKGESFRYLFDPECFLAACGIRTADASHPDYMKHHEHECLWNGPVWPFATSQTLTALINYLQSSKNPTVTSEEWLSLLLTYAYSHRDEDGTPYIDENMHPESGVWLAREIMRGWNRPDKDITRGRHYNHSTFIDLVITGICGIMPSNSDILRIHPLGTSLDFFSLEDVVYHSHILNIEWQKSKGITVTVDGKESYTSTLKDVPFIEIKL